MNKVEFLQLLKKRLAGIPENDLKQILDYYDEIISDKLEDGMSEEEAINSLGTMDDVVNSVLSEISIPILVKERFGLKRKLEVWEIVLLAVTSVLWIPLSIIGLVVILAIYICLWSGVICVASGAIYFAAHSLLVVSGLIDIFTGNIGNGFVLFGFGTCFIGLTIILTMGAIKFSKVMIIVCKKIILKVKSLFIRKGEENDF